MNLPKKLYCRAFQLGLKIALPFLPYRTPRVIGSIKALPQVIKKKRQIPPRTMRRRPRPFTGRPAATASSALAADPAWTAPRRRASVS